MNFFITKESENNSRSNCINTCCSYGCNIGCKFLINLINYVGLHFGIRILDI